MKQESKFKVWLRSPGTVSALASVLAIVVGLLIGIILLIVFNPSEAAGAAVKLLTTGFKSPARFSKVLYQAAPLIMTGLSVGFAFKTGLFNIGASGQFVIGTCCALLTGIVLAQPWYVAMLAALLGGAVWGMFPGLFKALFNVNEVITSIMFNWIGLFLTNLIFSNIPMMLASYWGDAQFDRTAALAKANPSAIIPTAGLDVMMDSTYMNISIFITIVFSLIIYVILQKTTFGYELKACGHNRNAAEYAGINAKRNIVLSMVIAGALSGVAGGIYYLAGTAQFVMEKILPAAGFNGIPVALLASSHPIGTIFSALFISYIQVGGEAMQPKYATETIDIIIAVIIYLSAFSLLMKQLIFDFMSRKKREEAAALAGANNQEVEKK